MGVALIISRCGSRARAFNLALKASRCARRSVLLVDDRQAQLGKAHLVLGSPRACPPPAAPRRGASSMACAPCPLMAAGQPRDADAQRLQPAHQLAKVLLGQDLGGRHQRALPACVDGDQCRAPPPRSCLSPHRPAASGAWAAAAPGLAQSPPPRCCCAAVSEKGRAASSRSTKPP